MPDKTSQLLTPCHALFISRQYRLFEQSTVDSKQKEEFSIKATLWRACYLNLIGDSQKTTLRLQIFRQLNDPNQPYL